MSFYDQDRGDVPEYQELRKQMVTARREHRCHFCKKPILPGQRYWRVVGIDDGTFGDYATHDLYGNCSVIF